MGIISWIVLGLIVGVLAKLIMPGKDPGGDDRDDRDRHCRCVYRRIHQFVSGVWQCFGV